MKKFRVWFSIGSSKLGITVPDVFEDWDNAAFLDGWLSVSNAETYETPTYYPAHRVQKIEAFFAEEVPFVREPGIDLNQRRI